MATLAELLLPEFDAEMASTRRAGLAAVPEEKFGWRPHAKSFTMGRLAGHVAEIFKLDERHAAKRAVGSGRGKPAGKHNFRPRLARSTDGEVRWLGEAGAGRSARQPTMTRWSRPG